MQFPENNRQHLGRWRPKLHLPKAPSFKLPFVSEKISNIIHKLNPVNITSSRVRAHIDHAMKRRASVRSKIFRSGGAEQQQASYQDVNAKPEPEPDLNYTTMPIDNDNFDPKPDRDFPRRPARPLPMNDAVDDNPPAPPMDTTSEPLDTSAVPVQALKPKIHPAVLLGGTVLAAAMFL